MIQLLEEEIEPEQVKDEVTSYMAAILPAHIQQLLFTRLKGTLDYRDILQGKSLKGTVMKKNEKKTYCNSNHNLGYIYIYFYIYIL